MAATVSPPFEGIRTNQRPQAGVRDGENLRVFSPVDNLPGEGRRKLSEGDIGAHWCLDGVL